MDNLEYLKEVEKSIQKKYKKKLYRYTSSYFNSQRKFGWKSGGLFYGSKWLSNKAILYGRISG